MSGTGTLYTVSAPSGAGKTSLVQALVARSPDIRVSVSHTTRRRRPGEQDGVNYFFVAEAEFEQMSQAEEFLEHAAVYGNRYGTSRRWVSEQLACGTDVILEIDWQGAEQVKRLVPETRAIFILPPSLETLRERLAARGQDDPATIAARMTQAVAELSHYRESDFLVVNQDFDTAVAALQAIVSSQRLHTRHQLNALADLLDALLS